MSHPILEDPFESYRKMNIYKALFELGIIKKECRMTLTLDIHLNNAISSSDVEVIGTVLPLTENDNLDIMFFLRDQICKHEHHPDIKAYVSYKEKSVEIKDNETFVWACAMYNQEKRKNHHLDLPITIFINNQEPDAVQISLS